MKIIVSGITGVRSRGVEALLVTLIDGLRRQWPECQITVLTYDFPFDSQQGYDVELVDNRVRKGSERRGWSLLRQLDPRGIRHMAELKRLFKSADLMVASGGDIFSSDYGAMGRHLVPVRLALDCGVPVFFLGHSIGRFKTLSDAKQWLSCAKRSLGVTLRESASYRYVTEDLGLTSVPVHQTADTAFLLEPPPKDCIMALRKLYGLDDSRACVACGVSHGIARFTAQDQQRHIEVLEQLLRAIT